MAQRIISLCHIVAILVLIICALVPATPINSMKKNTHGNEDILLDETERILPEPIPTALPRPLVEEKITTRQTILQASTNDEEPLELVPTFTNIIDIEEILMSSTPPSFEESLLSPGQDPIGSKPGKIEASKLSPDYCDEVAEESAVGEFAKENVEV